MNIDRNILEKIFAEKKKNHTYESNLFMQFFSNSPAPWINCENGDWMMEIYTAQYPHKKKRENACESTFRK